MTTPARFFTLPDGSQSHIQVNPETGAPVAVNTPELLAEWYKIQAAAPLSGTAYDARVAVSMARPLFGAEAEADAGGGASLLDGLRFAAEAQAGVTVVTEASAPASQPEYDRRADAAAQLAAALGLALVMVRDDPVMKVPAHLELRQSGNPYMAGDLMAIEKALSDMARERAGRDAQVRLWREHRERLERERLEAIASLPASRLARLEAALAAQGITVDA